MANFRRECELTVFRFWTDFVETVRSSARKYEHQRARVGLSGVMYGRGDGVAESARH